MYAQLKVAVTGCVVFFFVLAFSDSMASQENGLPADLLFTAGTQPGLQHTLVRVNGQTGAATPFYRNDEAGLVLPLQWSPNGQKLLILLIFLDEPQVPSYTGQLCLLNRAGELQTCFADKPYIAPWMRWEMPIASWSKDGRLVYFVADYGWEQTGLLSQRLKACLVEADAMTGQTLREVFCLPENTRSLAWSPQLDYVVTDPLFPQQDALINLESGEAINFYTAVAAEHVDDLRICPQFSPHGSFLVLIGSTSSPFDGDIVTIISKQGRLLHQIRRTQDGQEFTTYCPIAWSQDEDAIYLGGGLVGEYTAAVFRYTLATRTLEIMHSWGPDIFSEDAIFPPFAPSPDGTCLAGTANPPDMSQVVVLCGGKLFHLDIPYEVSKYPIWVPPAEEE